MDRKISKLRELARDLEFYCPTIRCEDGVIKLVLDWSSYGQDQTKVYWIGLAKMRYSELAESLKNLANRIG